MSKIRLERILDCDTDRLYGPLDKIIEYLQEVQATHPEAELEEHWHGYEDMELRFSWLSEETDEEYSHRLREEYKQREARKVTELMAEIKREREYKEKLTSLKKEFGK